MDKLGNKSIREVEVAKLFGERLKKRFLREIKLRKVPNEFFDRYSDLFSEFQNISKDRNEAVKAKYTIDENSGQISKLNMIAFHNWDPKKTKYEDFIDQWKPSQKLASLIEIAFDIENLLENFQYYATKYLSK